MSSASRCSRRHVLAFPRQEHVTALRLRHIVEQDPKTPTRRDGSGKVSLQRLNACPFPATNLPQSLITFAADSFKNAEAWRPDWIESFSQGGRCRTCPDRPMSTQERDMSTAYAELVIGPQCGIGAWATILINNPTDTDSKQVTTTPHSRSSFLHSASALGFGFAVRCAMCDG